MPEATEIRRAADKLEAAVAGKPLTHVWFAFPELKAFEAQLTGARVERFETRGKALLTHFSCGLTLYSHNQLYGVWRVGERGENAANDAKPARAAWKPKTPRCCFTAPRKSRCWMPTAWRRTRFCSASGLMCWICR